MTQQTNLLYSSAMEVAGWYSSVKFGSNTISSLLQNVAGFALPKELSNYWKHVEPARDDNYFIHVYLAETIQEGKIGLKFILTDSRTEVYIKDAIDPLPKESILQSVTDIIPIELGLTTKLASQDVVSDEPNTTNLNTNEGLKRINNWQQHHSLWIAYTLNQIRNLFFRGFRIPITDIQQVVENEDTQVYVMFGLKLLSGQPEPANFFDPSLYTAELIVGTIVEEATSIIMEPKILLADISTPVPPYNIADQFHLL